MEIDESDKSMDESEKLMHESVKSMGESAKTVVAEKNMIDMSSVITQAAFGDMVGISQQAVSAMIREGVLLPDQSAKVWLRAYCSRLREQAAGRYSVGDLDLTEQRARLASEQADKVAMHNKVMRGEYLPVMTLTTALADASRQIVSILDALKMKLKRQNSKLTADDLDLVDTEIATARNLAAKVQLDSVMTEDLHECA